MTDFFDDFQEAYFLYLNDLLKVVPPYANRHYAILIEVGCRAKFLCSLSRAHALWNPRNRPLGK